ncbi:hypothetical protein [Hymenobacter glacieicola]|uniref:Glycerophosphoryl diester phosphodiesterase membrane domain-containing protein n=1 Tax=Hymenobacter glacieicola TaxID=1562124 RepID=A0ABQ1X1X9_9BACT|nr:hypothetical protein [Hymenobacter glacieicola]GGG55923.1 hypothetical protein GCM10011378_35160 [Hymenobacter glacieicola]
MRHLAFTKPTDFLRERDFSQKIEATFDFIRVHATPLGRVLATLVLPLALVTGIGVGLLQGQMLSTFGDMARQARQGLPRDILPPIFTSPSLWITMLGGLLLLVVLHLVVYGYVVLRAGKADPDAPVTPAEVWALVKSRFLGMIGSFIGLVFVFIAGTMLIGFVMSIVGVALAAVAGAWVGIATVLSLYFFMIYAMVALSLYFVVWLREGRGFFGSIQRCFQLVWGKWWSTFGLIMVMFLMLWLIMVLVLVALSTVGLPFTDLLSGRATDFSPLVRVLLIVYSAIQTLISLVFYPLIMIAICFQYFNLVERRDGEGTRLLVDSIGQTAPTAAPQALRPDDEGEY